MYLFMGHINETLPTLRDFCCHACITVRHLHFWKLSVKFYTYNVDCVYTFIYG